MNLPWDTALLQKRDPGKRQPVPITNVFFSEESTICQLLIVVVYAVHLATSKLTLLLQNVLQPYSNSLLKGRAGHLAQCQQNETNQIAFCGSLTRLQAMDIDPKLRPTLRQAVSIQEF